MSGWKTVGEKKPGNRKPRNKKNLVPIAIDPKDWEERFSPIDRQIYKVLIGLFPTPANSEAIHTALVGYTLKAVWLSIDGVLADYLDEPIKNSWVLRSVPKQPKQD